LKPSVLIETIEREALTNVAPATLDEILADYTEQCRLEWKVRHDQEELRISMEKLLAGERQRWSRAVKQVLYARRPGWTYHESRVFHVINHDTRPMTVSIIVSVKVWYSVLLRSGTIELSGSIKEKQELLAELGRMICTANARPHAPERSDGSVQADVRPGGPQ